MDQSSEADCDKKWFDERQQGSSLITQSSAFRCTQADLAMGGVSLWLRRHVAIAETELKLETSS